MAASHDRPGKLLLDETFSVARHSHAGEENHRQGSGRADVSSVVQPGFFGSRKAPDAMERTVGASRRTQQASYCSERPRLSFPAALDADVRTGECRIDDISPGGTVSVPGLADGELSFGTSAISLVL